MIGLLFLVAASAPTAIDAERAFAREAQQRGQWTAFRKYAAEDSTMFVPLPIGAQSFLKDKKDPPVAIRWWPAQSIVSCDGKTAINVGPWRTAKASGYFTTVWERRAEGWRWVYDGGDRLSEVQAIPKRPTVRRAICPSVPIAPQPPREVSADLKAGSGASRDGTLAWSWTAQPNGARHFTATLWNGRRLRTVIDQKITGE